MGEKDSDREGAESLDALELLDNVKERALTWFTDAEGHLEAGDHLPKYSYDYAPTTELRDHYWRLLTDPLRERAEKLVDGLPRLAQLATERISRSPMLTRNDLTHVGRRIKQLRAALRLRHYVFWDAEMLDDEGTVLGVRQAGEADDIGVTPTEGQESFLSACASIKDVLDLTHPTGSDSAELPSRSLMPGYRPGTAFIMMWMDPSKPELDDVCATVKRCFSKFEIDAKRADDIEHEDVITKRILDEIATAEFLFADLSGERPSVYYEVGYAHAIGRRTMLYRKKGTRIHFDLAAYNCPEYENMTELETKLLKRLAHATGRQQKKNEPGKRDD